MDAHSACQPGARLEAKERREQRRLCYGVRSPARASRLCYPPVPRWCAPNRASPSPAGSGEQEQRSAYISGAIAEHVWVHRKVVHGERTPVVRGGADSGAARAANDRLMAPAFPFEISQFYQTTKDPARDGGMIVGFDVGQQAPGRCVGSMFSCA